MAKPIRSIEKKVPTEAERQAESLGDIVKAVSDNREAIVEFLDILKELQQSGVADILQGILKNRTSLGSIGFEFIQVANVPTMLKNVILLMQFVGRIDPKKMETLLAGVGKGVELAVHNPEDKPDSMWRLMGSLRDPDVRASLSTAVRFLRGMGEEVTKREEKAQPT